MTTLVTLHPEPGQVPRLRRRVTDPDHFADVALLNEPIAWHNRCYPIEASLPIEVGTGQLIERGVPWRPLSPVTTVDLLARARRPSP